MLHVPDDRAWVGVCVCCYMVPLFKNMNIMYIIYLILDTSVFGLGIVVVVFGYFLSLFRMKYEGYPYRYDKRRIGWGHGSCTYSYYCLSSWLVLCTCKGLCCTFELDKFKLR